MRKKFKVTVERPARCNIDAMLVEAVQSGSDVAMDNADRNSIRHAARAAVAKPRRKR